MTARLAGRLVLGAVAWQVAGGLLGAPGFSPPAQAQTSEPSPAPSDAAPPHGAEAAPATSPPAAAPGDPGGATRGIRRAPGPQDTAPLQAAEPPPQTAPTPPTAEPPTVPPAAPPPAAPPMAPPALSNAPPPPPPATGSAGGPDVVPAAPTLEFTALVQAFVLVRDSAAYVAASAEAPQMYPLRAGTPVMSAARSRDGNWVIALTEDGRAAYLPAGDLGPYDPGRNAGRDPNRTARDDRPPSISGEAQVVDTATLMINGQRLSLAGVEGEGADYARQLQSLISAQGRVVTCEPQGRGYLCKLPTGMDIARAALYNGAARAADDASEDYREQAESARAARRGLWR